MAATYDDVDSTIFGLVKGWMDERAANYQGGVRQKGTRLWEVRYSLLQIHSYHTMWFNRIITNPWIWSDASCLLSLHNFAFHFILVGWLYHLVSPETEAVHLPRGGERWTDAALSFACAAVGALARRLVAYMCWWNQNAQSVQRQRGGSFATRRRKSDRRHPFVCLRGSCSHQARSAPFPCPRSSKITDGDFTGSSAVVRGAVTKSDPWTPARANGAQDRWQGKRVAASDVVGMMRRLALLTLLCICAQE
jgi:hypothetical protein